MTDDVWNYDLTKADDDLQFVLVELDDGSHGVDLAVHATEYFEFYGEYRHYWNDQNGDCPWKKIIAWAPLIYPELPFKYQDKKPVYDHRNFEDDND